MMPPVITPLLANTTTIHTAGQGEHIDVLCMEPFFREWA